MATIIKDDAKTIVESTQSKFFLIVGIDTGGNAYSWRGNGFELIDDNDNGFLSMNVVYLEKAIAEFNKACYSAENNMKAKRLFVNGVAMKIVPLPTILNNLRQ